MVREHGKTWKLSVCAGQGGICVRLTARRSDIGSSVGAQIVTNIPVLDSFCT